MSSSKRPRSGSDSKPPDTKKEADSKAADAAFFSFVDQHADEYVARLAEMVAIPSVSAEPQRRPDVVRMVHWVQGWCDRLGGVTHLENIGDQTLPDGSTLLLPPVLCAAFGDQVAEPNKPTLVIYGHLDVQPATVSDGWSTEPFVLTEIEGKMFGRGASDDKGPMSCWLWIIEAYAKLDRPLPVHLRCVFEGMEESGSVGLPALVRRLACPGGFLDPDVCDHICISDNYYLGRKPCITHGLRGNVYWHLSVECSTKDMHSGVIGGSVHEAMTDLFQLMNTLVDSSGRCGENGWKWGGREWRGQSSWWGCRERCGWCKWWGGRERRGWWWGV